MAENRTLLSQSEIDALVSFLQQGGDTANASIGDVLDQSSIDKLVDIIRFNNNHGVYLNADTTAQILGAAEADILAPDGSKVDSASCELVFSVSDSGMARLFCKNISTGESYRISPESLPSRKHVADGKEWGRAISPRHFNKIANLFRLEFSKDTYKAVCERFSEVMFGDANAEPPAIYFPVQD